MRIAYLISAHTDPQHLQRLATALAAPDTHLFIHIDKKSDITAFTTLLCPEGKGTTNVHFLDNRIDVRWGTINEWYYQLALIEAAVSYPLHFDRLITLSGLDYPLWSNAKIEALLQQYQRKDGSGISELLYGVRMNEQLPGMDIHRRLRIYYNIPLLGNKWNTKLSILVRKITTALGYKRRFAFTVGGEQWHEYKAAAWWGISEELGRYVAETYRRHEDELLRQFRHQFCPAETMVATIAFNSELWKARCKEVDDSLTLEQRSPLCYFDYTTNIKIWRTADLPELIAANKPFARKLTTAESLPLIRLIDEQRQE